MINIHYDPHRQYVIVIGDKYCYHNCYIKDWVIDRLDIIAGSWL